MAAPLINNKPSLIIVSGAGAGSGKTKKHKGKFSKFTPEELQKKQQKLATILADKNSRAHLELPQQPVPAPARVIREARPKTPPTFVDKDLARLSTIGSHLSPGVTQSAFNKNPREEWFLKPVENKAVSISTKSHEQVGAGAGAGAQIARTSERASAAQIRKLIHVGDEFESDNLMEVNVTFCPNPATNPAPKKTTPVIPKLKLHIAALNPNDE